MNILFALSLFIAILFVSVNAIKAIRGHEIKAWSFVIMSASITAVITWFIGIW